ncbi:glycine/betaine/sarcosine/D-proline family reductase selenoprotein B [Pseudomonadales bacterium]|nr:glycine/betaine/sarcosine/D-proline family reductase selenoprotein B [Pseudomonadales bacterium]MDA7785061.1 glycine/betaine/sarcosine/D-proline family reductase selenoprotein B [Pseudomonadales bacterium]
MQLTSYKSPIMVRLIDLPEYERDHLLEKNMPPLGPLPWHDNAKPLSAKRIALITTAGLHFRGDNAFDFADPTFRPISIDDDANDLIMSHSSANFDRSGFVEDVNLVFPIERFQELLADKAIGSLADVHYSFMGAGLMPKVYEKSAMQVAGLLNQDQVDAVFLTPV